MNDGESPVKIVIGANNDSMRPHQKTKFLNSIWKLN